MCSTQTDRDFDELIFDQSPTLSVAQFPSKPIGCPPRPKFRHEPRIHADGRKRPHEHPRSDGLVFDSSSPFPSSTSTSGRSRSGRSGCSTRSGIGLGLGSSSDAPPTRIPLSKRKPRSRRRRCAKRRRGRGRGHFRRRRVGSRNRPGRVRGFSRSISGVRAPHLSPNKKHATFPIRGGGGGLGGGGGGGGKSPKLPFPVMSTSKCIRPWFSHKWKYHHIKTLKFEPDARSEIAELQNLGIFRRQSRERDGEYGHHHGHTMPPLGAPVRVPPGRRSAGNPLHPSSAPSTSYSSLRPRSDCDSDSDSNINSHSVLRRDSDLPELYGKDVAEDVSLGGSMHEHHRRQQQRRFVEDRVRRSRRSHNRRTPNVNVHPHAHPNRSSPRSHDRWQRVVFPVVEDEIWGFGFPTLDPFSEERVDDSRLYRMKKLIREKRRNRHFKSVWVNPKSILRPTSIRIGLVAWDEVVRQRLSESSKFKDGILMSRDSSEEVISSSEPSPRTEDSGHGCGWQVEEEESQG